MHEYDAVMNCDAPRPKKCAPASKTVFVAYVQRVGPSLFLFLEGYVLDQLNSI
jgi:hypothetical protein